MVKYAGADWIANTYGHKSSLGVKVANVLGQVYQGIYHLYNGSGLDQSKVYWNGIFAVTATVNSPLSTFDFSDLTLLVLCCQKAELSVGVYGSFKGYTRLIFTPNPGSTDLRDYFAPVHGDSTPVGLLENFTRAKKKLADIHNGEIWSIEGLDWHHLLRLVAIAHMTATRFQVQGRSPHALEIMVTQRKREGHMFERHPEWEEHLTLLRSIWDVDYSLI